jgi:hypothetical protein
MNRMLKALGSTFLLFATPAQSDLRPLDVPLTSGWQHAETGVILMPKLAGMERRSLADNGANEFDIVAQYGTSDGTTATIFLFHPGIDSVPLWFDRSRAVIEHLGAFDMASATTTPARSFAPPGSDGASALRISYALKDGRVRSSALAVIPTADWLVVVRLSSVRLEVAALDTVMTDFIAAIRWPTGVAPAPAALPVAACAEPLLSFAKAKLVKPDMTEILLGSMVASAGNKAGEAPLTYCRDGEGRVDYGVYRVVETGDGYAIALGDAGRAIGVWPAPALGKGPRRYSVTLQDLARSVMFPSFDRLPPPDQVIEMTRHQPPISVAERHGNKTSVTLDAAQLPQK